jgi:hypothetical protein
MNCCDIYTEGISGCTARIEETVYHVKTGTYNSPTVSRFVIPLFVSRVVIRVESVCLSVSESLSLYNQWRVSPYLSLSVSMSLSLYHSLTLSVNILVESICTVYTYVTPPPQSPHPPVLSLFLFFSLVFVNCLSHFLYTSVDLNDNTFVEVILYEKKNGYFPLFLFSEERMFF